MSFIEAPVTDDRNPHPIDFVEHDPERSYRSFQDRRKGDVEIVVKFAKKSTSFRRFRNTLLRQIDIFPTCEEVFKIPFALPMSAKYEFSCHEDSAWFVKSETVR